MYREITRYARSALMDVEVFWKFMVRKAEEISFFKRIKHRPKTFSLFESIRQSSFKNVTPISHKNSNLFFFAKEAVCTLYHIKLP